MRAGRSGLFAAALAALPAAAQEGGAPAGPPPPSASVTVPSPILTLDQERLFADSLWGRRVAAELDSGSAALLAENRRIEADLIAEEKSLTERRATMEPEAFRAEADAFDAKVVDIRRAQDGKARDLSRQRELERQTFYTEALPVMGALLRARGAVAILDRRAIFISANSIDVTDEMVAAIDAEVGDGAGRAPEPGSVEDQPAPQGQPGGFDLGTPTGD